MEEENEGENEEEYEEATQVVGMAGLFLLLLLAGTAGAWIWSCRLGHNDFSFCLGKIMKQKFDDFPIKVKIVSLLGWLLLTGR